MFGKKNAQLLEAAEAKISQQQEKLEWYQRHYDKQQGYIEDLYNVVADLSRQLGMVLRNENIERLQKSTFLDENSDFFLDLYLLFSSRYRKGKNVTCYFGKDLEELKRKFQDRDFKNSQNIYLTERLALEDLRTLFKEGLWRKTVEDSLKQIRIDRNLDDPQKQ
ncbi:MAG: hypothetical protein PHN84_06505 [Desulfuromonadaceae bacterium]|nr:hypothetical protein [Desulfuromonadaceae bacterium]MDD2854534.1 hypothetical protein [Desulfuromonadaceae bacterium]